MHQSEIKKAQRAIYLITRFKSDSISELEREELEAWVQLSSENLELFDSLKDSEEEKKALGIMNSSSVNDSFESLKVRMEEERILGKRRIIYKWFAAVAAILIISSVGFFFYSSVEQGSEFNSNLVVLDDVLPGGNRATLTLADGSTVDLSDNKNGIIVGDDFINYNDGTSVISIPNATSSPVIPPKPERLGSLRTPGMLALTTPRGGQYQIVLSDGTKVWLNAASTLKYPNYFKDKERIVEVEGEAYFEVARNEKQPFIVKTAYQEVEVLGTHFNINAYSNEKVIRTTLLEGSVQVFATLTSKEQASSISPSNNFLIARASKDHIHSSQILKPNQQSLVTGTGEAIKISSVNPASIVSWKEGDFVFDSNIKSIMRQISRWYNVNVVYEGNITNEEFGGRVSRSKKLSEVLQVLQETNKIRFEIKDSAIEGEERRVIVKPWK